MDADVENLLSEPTAKRAKLTTALGTVDSESDAEYWNVLNLNEFNSELPDELNSIQLDPSSTLTLGSVLDTSPESLQHQQLHLINSSNDQLLLQDSLVASNVGLLGSLADNLASSSNTYTLTSVDQGLLNSNLVTHVILQHAAPTSNNTVVIGNGSLSGNMVSIPQRQNTISLIAGNNGGVRQTFNNTGGIRQTNTIAGNIVTLAGGRQIQINNRPGLSNQPKGITTLLTGNRLSGQAVSVSGTLNAQNVRLALAASANSASSRSMLSDGSGNSATNSMIISVSQGAPQLITMQRPLGAGA